MGTLQEGKRLPRLIAAENTAMSFLSIFKSQGEVGYS